MQRNDFQEWSRERQALVERTLSGLLPQAGIAPGRLHSAMRYSVLEGGKRVRPLLAFAAAELGGAAMERAARAGCAVELIHAYSLVHDDLPAMDNDLLRRGKPTCHVEYDEPTALLVGDALQSLAFQVLAESEEIAVDSRIEMVRILARASGSQGMAGGQAIDLDSVGKPLELPELEFMHILKTGELIRAATLLGGLCGELSRQEFSALDQYAKSIGLAFQVIDDLLDAESNTATLGKTAGKDQQNNKPTYVSLLGVKDARSMAEQLHQRALQAISDFGPRAARLAELADFIVLRKY